MDLIDFGTIFSNPDNAKILTAALLGALVGLERELSGKDPSLRTFSLICIGSAAFSIVSSTIHITTEVGPNARLVVDPGRIAAQIVVGIGFLGAGTIYRSSSRITGLTTAALMWVTAAIGTLVGFGHADTAISVTVIALSVTIVLTSVHKLIAFIRKDDQDREQS